MNSQITNEAPRSSFMKLNKEVPIINMPSFDLKKIQEEDKVNDLDRSKSYRFGYKFKVDLGLKNSGSWEELANGDHVWRLTVRSEGANTLNFIFDSYELAEGATVHLYNKDKTFVLGAYTNKMNNENNSLGTWIANGDEITIEYYVPVNVKRFGTLHIGTVVHGYRSISDFEAHQKQLNDSGDCNQDVNCDVGSDFEDIKDKLKKSVALVLANGSDWCSGTLINNTSNNKAPYLLTAFHCQDLESVWSFRFNWISANTICASSEGSIDNGSENYYQTTSGAINLAKNAASDFRLIEITGGLDDSWNLEWAGWDRTDNTPSYTVGIHHPSGDIMKICRDDSSPVKTSSTIDGQTSQVWRVADWDLGVTERGSSGSALFDPEGRVIGQLFGGRAFCNGTNDNNEEDVYGRFSVSWDTGTSNDTRLSNWLDPLNKGCLVLNMLSQEISGNPACDSSIDPEEEEQKNLVFYPNPTYGELLISNMRNDDKFEFLIYNIFGKKVLEGFINDVNDTINMSVVSSGVYFIEVKNKATGQNMLERIMVY